MNVSDVQYTAGLGGFLVLFGLGLVLWFLGRDLSRRLRRMRQQESLRQDQPEVSQEADREGERPKGDASQAGTPPEDGPTPARE